MGFIDTATGTNRPVFYNLVHAVGENCPNMPDDVKLIQYLLKSFYSKIPNHESCQEISLNGIVDSITRSWIFKFQIEANHSHPGKVLIDNRIDRIRQKDFIGTVSHTVYSLAVLNSSVLKYNPEAFLAAPQFVPMENITKVPPPSWDIVQQQRKLSTFDSIKQTAIGVTSNPNNNLGEIKRLAINIANQ